MGTSGLYRPPVLVVCNKEVSALPSHGLGLSSSIAHPEGVVAEGSDGILAVLRRVAAFVSVASSSPRGCTCSSDSNLPKRALGSGRLPRRQ